MPAENHQQGNRHDAGQGGRDGLGNAWQQVNDGHGQRDQAQHGVELHARHPDRYTIRPRHFEVTHLRQKNHDGQTVDEAEHDREGHHADELAQLQ